MEVMEDMTAEEENMVLNHKIRVTEKRLEVLGVTDLIDIRL